MSSQLIETDVPGIFRCPDCGLQNPRPTINGKPFYHQCGANTPREAAQIAVIVTEICPACEWHRHAECFYGAKSDRPKGVPVTLLAARDGSCPAGKW
jgi:hypothetical protein